MTSKPIRKTDIDREKIQKALQKTLELENAILFAYVHGSFLETQPFRDIDIAIYLSAGLDDPVGFALDLGARLEKQLRSMEEDVPVDVQVLNQAPLSFRYHVFRGKLLCSKNERLRVQMVEHTVSRYLDIKPLRHRAINEAITSWASIET